MTIITQEFYSVRCDYPDCKITTSDLGEYASWSDDGQAVDEWRDHDGLVVEDYFGVERHYCREHTTWNDDEDEEVPLPEGIEGEFILAERRIRMVIEQATERALNAHHRRCSDWMHRDQRKIDAIEVRLANEALRRSIARTFDIPVELLTPPEGHIPRWQAWDLAARQIDV